MDTLLQDLRYAARQLVRSPGFTLVAVLALALGIGANSAVFSMVDAVAFRPLPVPEAERLVALFGARSDSPPLNFSYPEYQDYRANLSGFSDVAAFTEAPVSMSDGGDAEIVWSNLVTANYFSVLGLQAARGRLFLPDEDGGSGAEPVVVLSHRLWRQRFGADPDMIGGTIRLNGHSFTVVGIAPERFLGTRLFSFAPDLWVPLSMHAQVIPGSDEMLDNRELGQFQIFGRLRSGASLAEASASASVIAGQLAEVFPETNGGKGVRTYSNRTPINPWAFEPRQIRFAGGLLMVGVALILLIACANVANLLLARATTRRKEIAVRISLGAGRRRLIRQLFSESLLLAIIGGAAGLVLAVWAVELSGTLIPPLDFAPALDVSVDGRVLAFTLLASLFTGIVFGLVPALKSFTRNVAPTLRDETAGSGSRRSRLRDALVVAQVAISLVVLIAAGLFAQSLRHYRAIDPGFVTRNALVLTLDPELRGYDRERTEAFYAELLRRIRALPGVRSATRAGSLPLDGSSSSTTVVADGRGITTDDQVFVDYNDVGLDYFSTMGTPILQGRDFTESDTQRSTEVVVVNEALARRLWPGEDPIGKRIRLGGPDGDAVEVLGVARSGKYRSLAEDPRPAMFFNLMQNYRSRTTLLIRTEGDPTGLYLAIRREVRSLDPSLPISGMKTLAEHIEGAFSAVRGGASLTAAFALLALLLAASGIYGVIAYTVVQRTREIGIRMALGARQSQVVGNVVRQGLSLAGFGVAIGLIAALLVTRVLSSMLYGIAPNDPATFVAGVLILSLIAMLAAYLPARRATRVDPMIALRTE